MKFVYIVITRVPKDDEEGNLYDDFLVYRRRDERDDDDELVLTEPPASWWSDNTQEKPVPVRLQNFSLGEVLICDEYGREVAGRGRKPSKWYVETEKFDSLEAAVARAQAVLEEDLKKLHEAWEKNR